MKLQIASDIHLELLSMFGCEIVFRNLKKFGKDVDFLILAGDICCMDEENYPKLEYFIKKCSEFYPRILYVVGNHEYYHTNQENVANKLHQLRHDYNISAYSSCNYTDGNIQVLMNTLWFPDTVEARNCSSVFSDFRRIERLDTFVWDINKNFIKTLEETCDSETIVITHHMPSFKSVPRRYQNNSTNMYFVTDLEYLIKEKKPKLWIHGHTHQACNYMIEETKVIANPMGYPGEHHTNFRYDCIIDI